MAGPTIGVHHHPADADGRVWMLARPEGQVWRLTDDEFRQLSADALLALAGDRAGVAQPVDFGSSFADIAARIDEGVF